MTWLRNQLGTTSVRAWPAMRSPYSHFSCFFTGVTVFRCDLTSTSPVSPALPVHFAATLQVFPLSIGSPHLLFAGFSSTNGPPYFSSSTPLNFSPPSYWLRTAEAPSARNSVMVSPLRLWQCSSMRPKFGARGAAQSADRSLALLDDLPQGLLRCSGPSGYNRTVSGTRPKKASTPKATPPPPKRPDLARGLPGTDRERAEQRRRFAEEHRETLRRLGK